MKIPELEALQNAIYKLHGCESTWLESVEVMELFPDRTVWKGKVAVFAIEGHRTAKKVYAWSHAEKGSRERRNVVVLHQGPVDSANAAVRVAITQQRRASR